MRLEDKIAIITGAGSGIGLATLRRFVEEGATVVAADREDPDVWAASLSRLGDIVLPQRTDVSRADDVAVMVRTAMDAFGRIDLLINNAGIALSGDVTETSEADWETLMGVNLRGVFLCSRTVIPEMRRSGGGVIVNVASQLGLVAVPKLAAYCTSKGAVVQLTRVMAIDHAEEGIRVNAVCPGPTETPMVAGVLAASEDAEGFKRALEDGAAMRRLGRPEEIADTIVFLASDESSYMTGSIVVVDGGWTAK